MDKARKNFFIIFSLLVLFTLIGTYVFRDFQNEITNVPADFKDGKVLPSRRRYTESPFVFDAVANKNQELVFYDSKNLGLEGRADFTHRYILDADSKLKVVIRLKDREARPRVWLYDSESKLQDWDEIKYSEDILVYIKDIEVTDLYKLRVRFNYEDVLKITSYIETKKEKDSLALIREYYDKGLKVFELKMDEGQFANYLKLKKKQAKNLNRPLPKGLRWKPYPSPKGRVSARMRARDGSWSLISLGLAGRNEAHLVEDSILSSLDIKIVSGGLIYGLKKFKLYSLQSKNYMRDFLFESTLKDQGMFFPRQDIVKVVINGKDYGYMELLEGVDSAVFEYSRRQEGSVIGYSSDALLSSINNNALVEKDEFKKIKSLGKDSLYQNSFSKNLCDDSVINALAFALGIGGFHGLGQSDIRFHRNNRKDCIETMIRDTDSGLPLIIKNNKLIFSSIFVHLAHFYSAWRPIVATLSSNFVILKSNGNTQNDQNFYHWNATPVLLNYLSEEKNFNAVLDYTKLWDQDWMKAKQINRFKNLAELFRLKDHQLSKEQLKPISMSLSKGIGIIKQMPKFYDKTATIDPYTINLKNHIEQASEGRIKVSNFELKTLNWRNQQINSFSKELKEQNKLYMGEPLAYKNLVKFLYRKETEDKSYLFFITRNLYRSQQYNLKLHLKDSNEVYRPYSFYKTGSINRTADKYDIALDKLYSNEAIDILVFELPKGAENQYLVPEIEGSATYWGIREYLILPIDETLNQVKPNFNKLPSSELFYIRAKTIIPRQSNLEINESIYIPKDYTLVIKADQVFSFREGTCIQVWGELDVSNNAHLHMKSQSDSWQGAHFHDITKLQNITVDDLGTGEYGVECFEREYSGGFSIFDSNLEFNNITVTKSKVEDSIHFLRSEVQMENIFVQDAQSDAIDADFCVINANNLTLLSSGSDGLDVSGTYANVRNSNFSGHKDKGVSLGENSYAEIYNSLFSDNYYGIAVKDSSAIDLMDNDFKNNKYGVVYYSKKAYFSIPLLNEKEILLKNNFEADQTKIKNLKFNPK
jgi:parallel beta-helix repeat protein